MFRVLLFAIAFAGSASAAVDRALLARLGAGDNDQKIAVIGELVATGDPEVVPLLRTMAEGNLKKLIAAMRDFGLLQN